MFISWTYLRFLVLACRTVNERNAFLNGNRSSPLWVESWAMMCFSVPYVDRWPDMLVQANVVEFLFKTYRKVERIVQWVSCKHLPTTHKHTPHPFFTKQFENKLQTDDTKWSYFSFSTFFSTVNFDICLWVFLRMIYDLTLNLCFFRG